MKITKLSLILFSCFVSILLNAGNLLPNGNFTDTSHWKINQKGDLTATIADGCLTLKRGTGKGLLRAFQNISAEPNKSYLLVYEVKIIQAPWELATALILFRDKKGKWLPWSVQHQYSPKLKPDPENWQQVIMTISIPSDVNMFRIGLGISGKNLEVKYRNILVELIEKNTTKNSN